MTTLPYFCVLLTVLSGVIAADFEYDAEIVQDIARMRAHKLQYDLIHPAVKVLFRRTATSDGKGHDFYIDNEWKGEKPSDSLHGKPVELCATLRSRPAKSSDECNGRPGIQAILKSKYFENWGAKSWTKREAFCLNEMHINLYQNRDGKPYMTLTVRFKHYANEQNIGVTVHLFRPSKNQENNEKAKENQVPIIDSPAPFQAVVHDKDGSQMFVGDILWMTEVLKLAKLHGSETDTSGKYTEDYIAGPIILQPSLFQKILDLGFVFE